jgi:hypothetical protein
LPAWGGCVSDGGYYRDQGNIFAVIIKNIAQINALNQTYAYQSNKIFLSNTINNALRVNNTTITSVIDDLKKYDGGATPILSYDPVNPLSLFPDNEYVLPFSCMQNDTFNILDKFINTQTFRTNSNFLSPSDVKKLTFNVKGILAADYDDPNKLPLSDVAELGNNNNTINTTIKFLSSGLCTIFYQVEPFNDVENIFNNPNGPSFYEVKSFSLKIRARVFTL